MRQPMIQIGRLVSGGAAINLDLGGYPDYFKVVNENAAVTEVAVLEYIRGMGDGYEVQYDKFLAGTSAGDFFLKQSGSGYLDTWDSGVVVGEQMSVTFDDTGGAKEDLLTVAAGHGLRVNDLVQFVESGGLPTNLDELTRYYVVDVPSSTTFRISATLGGSVVDLGSDGTPSNYVINCNAATLGSSSAGKGVTISASFSDDGDTLWYMAVMGAQYVDHGDVG